MRAEDELSPQQIQALALLLSGRHGPIQKRKDTIFLIMSVLIGVSGIWLGAKNQIFLACAFGLAFCVPISSKKRVMKVHAVVRVLVGLCLAVSTFYIMHACGSELQRTAAALCVYMSVNASFHAGDMVVVAIVCWRVRRFLQGKNNG